MHVRVNGNAIRKQDLLELCSCTTASNEWQTLPPSLFLSLHSDKMQSAIFFIFWVLHENDVHHEWLQLSQFCLYVNPALSVLHSLPKYGTCDFMLLTWHKWDLHSSGMLCSTDISLCCITSWKSEDLKWWGIYMPKLKDGCFTTYLVTTGVPFKHYARPHILHGILTALLLFRTVVASCKTML